MTIATNPEEERNGCEIFWQNNMGTYSADAADYISDSEHMVNFNTSESGVIVPVLDGQFSVIDSRPSTHFIALTKDGLAGGSDRWELYQGISLLRNIDVNYDDFDKIFITEFDEEFIDQIEWGNASSGNKKYIYLFIGKPLKMPIPIFGNHGPLDFNTKTIYQSDGTKGGQFLGRRVRSQTKRTKFTFNNLDLDFYRNEFAPFAEHAKYKPFFIRWRPDKFSEEIHFGMVEGTIRPVMQNNDLVSVTLDFVGHVYNANS